MLPPVVVTTSPKGARDVLSRSYPFVDRTQPVFTEHRRIVGGSLFNFKHEAWLPRRRALQPVFTKQHVTQFAGHMAEGADKLSHAWGDGAELDLDQRVPPTDAAGVGSIGAWPGPRRTGRCAGGSAASHRRDVHHRSRRTAGPRPVVAADPRPAARTRCQCHLSSTRRRHSPSLPGRPDSRRTTGSRADRRQLTRRRDSRCPTRTFATNWCLSGGRI